MIVFGTSPGVRWKGPGCADRPNRGPDRSAAARRGPGGVAVVFFVWRNLDKKLMATVGADDQILHHVRRCRDRLAALRAGEGIGQFFRWKFDFVHKIQTIRNRVSPAIWLK